MSKNCEIKEVDESMADQKSSLHSIPNTVANHQQHAINDNRMLPVGDKAMQSGNFD
jgi:hypothetical protein